MNKKSDLYSLCCVNGFRLREYPLIGRLLVVVFKPKIFIKSSLDEQKKRLLVKKTISHLLTHSDCRLAIYWEGKEQFFNL